MTHLWNRSRGYATGGALVALAIVAVAVGYQAYHYRLPDPSTADQAGLLKWMVLRDMAAQTPEIQDQLVIRLEEELRQGVDLNRVDGEVSEERRRQFWSNVDILLERWFQARCEAFHALPETDRGKYVQESVSDVLTWQFVRDQRAVAASQGSSDTVLVSQCERRVLGWRDSATPELAEQYSRLLVRIKADLMMRYIQGEL